MGSDLRTALLGLGIAFCIGLGAMTISVIVELEISEWKFSVILLIGFLVAAVAVIAMILIALISAMRNPPED
ncbi:MAG TPA: hypothetical protein VK919_15590 [Solirubrobacterales bacterium]|nr:hypothetical protein [Solirubrobacterales bacterium]